MSLDFPLLLVLLTLGTGAVWALDSLWLKPRRQQRVATLKLDGESDGERLDKAGREPYLVEMSRSFFPIILIVLVVRSFIVEPFRIPSGSMMPTLLIGDFILVNKFAYGVRLPVVNLRILDTGSPQRGDVAVFRYPENPKIDFIKRIVGVPGDRVVYMNKVLYINGEQAPQHYLGSYVGIGSGNVMTGARHLQEELNGVEHEILVMPGRNEVNGNFDYLVPEGNYFAMGDNRDNSRDSRYWGLLPEENLVGKAFMIWMNWDWQQDGVVGWGRLGNGIH
ncbi:MAG: signal peptidase I [Gammaproteobacteria bacterium]|nr:signal peptidase I [Gammaproteobacteria bacterium]